jgi:hypothetical protein
MYKLISREEYENLITKSNFVTYHNISVSPFDENVLEEGEYVIYESDGNYFSIYTTFRKREHYLVTTKVKMVECVRYDFETEDGKEIGWIYKEVQES